MSSTLPVSYIMNCETTQLQACDILTVDEIVSYQTAHIAYNDMKAWRRLMMMQAKITQALEDGVIEETENFVFQDSGVKMFNVISDSVGGGINGIKNMADGKHYDSKSAYRKALRAQGMVEMGTDAPKEGKKTLDGDFNCEKDVAQAMRQVEAYKKTGDPGVFKR